MKQRYLTLMGIAAILASPLCLAADATTPATETKPAATDAKTTPATETKATTEGTVAEGTAKPAKPAYCKTEGRIRVRADSEKGCENASKPYRSYSKEQIDTTGKISVAEALEEIDPIFHPN